VYIGVLQYSPQYDIYNSGLSILFVGIIKNILLTFHQEVNMKILSFFKPLLVALVILVFSGCAGTPLQMETEAKSAQSQYDLDRKNYMEQSHIIFIKLIRGKSHYGVNNGVLDMIKIWRIKITNLSASKKVKAAQDSLEVSLRGPELAQIILDILGIDLSSPSSPEIVADLLGIDVEELTWGKNIVSSL
jgi:hypothetical protein